MKTKSIFLIIFLIVSSVAFIFYYGSKDNTIEHVLCAENGFDGEVEKSKECDENKPNK